MIVPKLQLHPDDSRLRSIIRAIRSPDSCWPERILHDPLVVARVRDRTVALVCDPDALREVLSSDTNRFPRWLPVYRPTADGKTRPNSIFVVDEHRWRGYRDAFAPLFAPNNVDVLVANSVSATEVAVARCMDDATTCVTRAALDIIWRTLLGDGPDARTSDDLDDQVYGLVDASRAGDLRAANQWIDTLVPVARHRGPGALMGPDAPMARMTNAGSAACPHLSDAEISDNFLALLYSGQETTVTSIQWAIWLLGQDPGLQDELRAEIREILGEAVPTRSSLQKLRMLDSVLRETLRLLTPSISTARSCTEPFEVAGELLPAGSVLVVPIYAVHRHRSLWEDPEAFRPERHARKLAHPMAYIPFSAGSHTCLAAKSSWYELMAILVTLLRRVQFTTSAPEEVGLHNNLVLRPTCGYDVRLERL
ncbi:cytochrome P450 [Microbaculum marinum]|uniref:Cytochrome P450 n=1 Tax=Microbaculum marinum TaxID=1764581 RepID=A0AAW9RXT7_9HYPH